VDLGTPRIPNINNIGDVFAIIEGEAFKEQQALIIDEIAAEHGWDERFAKTQDQLGALMRSARAEVAEGNVVSGDPSDRPAQ
jgi:hypothetical protein